MTAVSTLACALAAIVSCVVAYLGLQKLTAIDTKIEIMQTVSYSTGGTGGTGGIAGGGGGGGAAGGGAGGAGGNAVVSP